ncbi:ABC transporter substrate-binding protein [Nesterenkonia muleiensis]|uniref:ABC transporter substrate-binding protein n=1 Tax=Nesterenkonia muleiensis TaxID=2282648 RepID=UPI0013001A9A|nr:extracellular solute-binding protein [Nesterenkonia muleiensis]
MTLTLGNSQWLDANRGEGLWEAVSGFDHASEHSVERVEYPSGDIATTLTTELGAGEGPDVMFIQDNVFESFVDADFLEPLEDAVEGANLNNTNEGGVKDGTRYGVAWQRAPFALLYNSGLLDEAGVEVPTTPEELIESADILTEELGVQGFGDPSPLVDDGRWLQHINIWTYGHGGSWADEDGNITVDTPENIEGVEVVKDLYDAGIFSDEDLHTNRAAFAQGQVGMVDEIGGGALVASLEGGMDPQDIHVADQPTPEPGYHQQLYVVVNANSPHVEEAKEFVSWLVTEEGQEMLREASGADPLATDVPVTEEFAAENPWAEGFLEVGSHTQSTLIPGHELQTTEIMTLIMDHVQEVLVNDIPAEEALAAAQGDVDNLVGSGD